MKSLWYVLLAIILFLGQGLYRTWKNGGKFDAVPEHLDSADKWKGTDWDTWYQRWMLKFHGCFSFGPLSHFWWARWKNPPKTLLKIGSGPTGTWRYEGDPITGEPYISRIQYYQRWHFAIHWPFLITFHFYFKASDVPQTQYAKLGDFLDNKLFYFYLGTHYDQDAVYWCPSAYLGLTWK